MLQYWSSRESVTSTADDARTLSLHVLSSAGFGKSYSFRGSLDLSPTNVATSYKESLRMILDNCILLMVLGPQFISKSWLPKKLNKLHQATVTFKQYMIEVYEEEKQSIAKGKPGAGNLTTSLIRASKDVNATTKTSNQEGGLTENEIYGNIFVFNFAGHDTTAHTLAFAIMLLAAQPSVQDWLSQELQYVLGSQRPEEWNYPAVFHRLKWCLAVLVSLAHPCQDSSMLTNQMMTVRDGASLYPCPHRQINWKGGAHAYRRRQDRLYPCQHHAYPKPRGHPYPSTPLGSGLPRMAPFSLDSIKTFDQYHHFELLE